jgi:hypothetical protein
MEQTREILSPENLPYYSTVVARQERGNLNNVMATKTQTENGARLKMPVSSKTNLLRRLCLASCVMFGLVLVTGFVGVDNIDVVKKSILSDLDDTLSIGDAFDQYKYFTKTEWKEFKTAQGKEVVEMTGYCKNWAGFVKVGFVMNDGLREDEDGHLFRLGYGAASILCWCGKTNTEKLDKSHLQEIWKNKDIYASIEAKWPNQPWERHFIGNSEVKVNRETELCGHDVDVSTHKTNE